MLLKHHNSLACVVVGNSCETTWIWQPQSASPSHDNFRTCIYVWPLYRHSRIFKNVIWVSTQHYGCMYAYTKRPFQFVFLQLQILQIWKTLGWWFMALCCYSGIYVIERVQWTNCAKEKAFKRQFVDYASEKLRSEVSVISAKCSGQVRQ